MMLKTEITIPNHLGLHTRASAKLLECACRHQANITIEYGQKKANAKSILDLISLCANKGAKITVTTEGPDAQAAMTDITALIAAKFHEAE